MEGEFWFGVEDEGVPGPSDDETTEITDPTLVDPTAVAGTVRRRRPQVRLTAELLVGERGLPYVMKNAPKRIRISKRRNAHDNLSHIVQFYQLWAHDLYPKAKFNDFVKLCQSLGKSDKLLREYRKNLYREEIVGQEQPERSNDKTDAVSTNVEGLEDDLYTTPSRQPAGSQEEADFERMEPSVEGTEEPPRPTEQELDTQELDMQDMFEEDQDAMEAMRELGF